MWPPSRLVAACSALAVWAIPAAASACAARPAEQDAAVVVIAAAARELELRAGGADVPLHVVGEDPEGARTTLSARLRRAGAGRQIYLTFAGVTVQTPPGVSYNVYLNRSAGEPEQGAASPHYLGTINFYNARPDPSREIALNVTAPIERLLARDDLDAGPVLSISPAGDPDPAASPRIQTIRLVAR